MEEYANADVKADFHLAALSEWRKNDRIGSCELKIPFFFSFCQSYESL